MTLAVCLACSGRRNTQGDGSFLGPDIDLRIAVRRFQTDATEPGSDDVDFDSDLQQVYRGGMPEHMWRDAPRLAGMG